MKESQTELSESALEEACKEIRKIQEESKIPLNIKPRCAIKMIPHKESITLENGKYTIESVNGILSALRHGEPWRKDDLIGDKLVGAMLNRILAQELMLMDLRECLEKLACLGNRDKHGNSVGNKIAQDALNKLQAQLDRL